MIEKRTDGPGQIAKEATPLLRDMLNDWQRLWDRLWNEQPEPTSQERSLILSRQVDLFGSVYLLAVLREIDPQRADKAADFLAETWDDGSSLGEWIYQWRQEMAADEPLTVSFDEPPA